MVAMRPDVNAPARQSQSTGLAKAEAGLSKSKDSVNL